jgi:hypothetical protein
MFRKINGVIDRSSSITHQTASNVKIVAGNTRNVVGEATYESRRAIGRLFRISGITLRVFVLLWAMRASWHWTTSAPKGSSVFALSFLVAMLPAIFGLGYHWRARSRNLRGRRRGVLVWVTVAAWFTLGAVFVAVVRSFDAVPGGLLVALAVLLGLPVGSLVFYFATVYDFGWLDD